MCENSAQGLIWRGSGIDMLNQQLTQALWFVAI